MSDLHQESSTNQAADPAVNSSQLPLKTSLKIKSVVTTTVDPNQPSWGAAAATAASSQTGSTAAHLPIWIPDDLALPQGDYTLVNFGNTLQRHPGVMQDVDLVKNQKLSLEQAVERFAPLQDNSVAFASFIYSLEYLGNEADPKQNLLAIMRELFRVCAPKAVVQIRTQLEHKVMDPWCKRQLTLDLLSCFDPLFIEQHATDDRWGVAVKAFVEQGMHFTVEKLVPVLNADCDAKVRAELEQADFTVLLKFAYEYPNVIEGFDVFLSCLKPTEGGEPQPTAEQSQTQQAPVADTAAPAASAEPAATAEPAQSAAPAAPAFAPTPVAPASAPEAPEPEAPAAPAPETTGFNPQPVAGFNPQPVAQPEATQPREPKPSFQPVVDDTATAPLSADSPVSPDDIAAAARAAALANIAQQDEALETAKKQEAQPFAKPQSQESAPAQEAAAPEGNAPADGTVYARAQFPMVPPFAMHVFVPTADKPQYVSRAVLTCGMHEPAQSCVVIGLLQQYLIAGEQIHVANIGANLGWYALLTAMYNERVFVDAFEPTPETVKMLEENVHINDLDEQVRVFPMAVSDEVGQAELFINDTNAGSNSLTTFKQGSNGFSKAHKVTVPTVTLDEVYLQQDPRMWPDIVIMDVEGHEQKVIDGTQGLFKAGWCPVIITEFSPSLLTMRGKCSFYRELVEKYNYKLALLNHHPHVEAILSNGIYPVLNNVDVTFVSLDDIDKGYETLKQNNPEDRHFDLLLLPEFFNVEANMVTMLPLSALSEI